MRFRRRMTAFLRFEGGSLELARVMATYFDRVKRMSGFLAPGLVMSGTLAAACNYHDAHGSFSIFDHYVSDLGTPDRSILAPVFNGSLVAGGLLLALFLYSLGSRIGNAWGRWAGRMGILMGACCSLVGLVTAEHLEIHLPMAIAFFVTGIFVVALFSVAIHVDGRNMSLGLLVAGSITVAAFAAFLAQLYWRTTWIEVGRNIAPPAIRLAMLLEWIAFVSIHAWIVAIACRYRRAPPPSAAEPNRM